MNIYFKHVIRNIWSNKFKSIIIIISLALTTLILYSNMSVSDEITEKYMSLLKENMQNYDISIQKESEESGIFNLESLNLDDVSISESFTLNSWQGSYSDKHIGVSFQETNLNQVINDKLCMLKEESSTFNTDDKRYIVISEATADKYELKLDDVIEISTIAGKFQFTVGGIAENKGLYSSEGSSYILILGSENTVKNEALSKNTMLYLDVDGAEDIDLDEVVDTIKANNENYKITKLVDYTLVNQSIGNTKNILTILLVVVIGISFFVISSLTKLLLATRIPVVGTFRSIGSSKFMVEMLLLAENSVYGVIGGLLGVGAAVLFNKDIVTALTGYTDIETNINVKYIIFSVLFSVLLQSIIVLVDVIKSSKQNIIKCVFNKVDVAVTIKIHKFLIGLLLLVVSVVLYYMNDRYDFLLAVFAFAAGIIGGSLMFTYLAKCIVELISRILKPGVFKMAVKNVIFTKSTSTNVSLGAISLAAILMVYSIASSLGGYFENALTNTLDADYVVTGMSKSLENYKFLNTDDNITDIIELYSESGITHINDVKFPGVQIIGMKEVALGIKDKSNLLPDLKENEVLIDEIFAKKNGFEIGDSLEVKADYIKDDTVNLIVKGFVDVGEFNTGRSCLLINEESFFNNVSTIPNMLLLSVKDTSESLYDELIEKINQNGLILTTSEDYVGTQENSVNQVLSLIYALIGLTGILVIVGIINNQLVGFLQRQREYAILSSIAMSRSQLRLMMMIEVMFSFLISCILGGSLGLWLNKLVEKLLFGLGICINNNIDISKCLILILGVFVLLSLTSIVPMLRLRKIDVVEQIKNEG
ncbi:MAG: ABC transporter permease [Clostridium sp.]|nr:ABC transporter permease [Clostridium sp.]